MPVTGSVTLSALAKQTATLDLGNASADISLSLAISLANGTGAGQFDRVWSDQRNIVASGTDDLDLVGTALLDPYGAAVTFPKVTGVFIQALPANTNNVIVGAAAANPWATLLNSTGTVTLRPGAFLFVGCGSADTSGYTTTAGTGDLLRVANSAGGTAVDYKIVVFGKSA